MKIKRIVCTLMVVVMVSSTIGMVASAAAPNKWDERYEFRLTATDRSNGTRYREKNDASSVYVKVDSNTLGYTQLFVDGAHEESPGDRFKNCTLSGSASFQSWRRNGHYSIKNYVNEWGYSWARLTTWKDGTGTGTIKGWWSPDSVGTYTSLN